MEATRLTRPHWYASFIEGRWGAFEGMAFPEFSEQVHVVEPFEIPDHWERFESMDHGVTSPTAWHAWAADTDGNLVVIGEHYEAGQLVSHHAARVLELRKAWHPEGCWPPVWADPSTGAKIGVADRWGDPASVKTEYLEHGIVLTGGNNDRLAGYSRLLELLHVEPGRLGPRWSHVPESAGGSPHLFVFKSCGNLIGQLQSAPIAAEGVGAGVAVDPKWESAPGHAIASARYGAMSWQPPAKPPHEEIADPRHRKIASSSTRGTTRIRGWWEWITSGRERRRGRGGRARADSALRSDPSGLADARHEWLGLSERRRSACCSEPCAACRTRRRTAARAGRETPAARGAARHRRPGPRSS
jgi:hypothetical protein